MHFQANMNSGDVDTLRDDLHILYAQNFDNSYDYLWEQYTHSVNINQVREVITSLDVSKGSGLSLLTASLVKDASDAVVALIHMIIEVIFETNIVP